MEQMDQKVYVSPDSSHTLVRDIKLPVLKNGRTDMAIFGCHLQALVEPVGDLVSDTNIFDSIDLFERQKGSIGVAVSPSNEKSCANTCRELYRSTNLSEGKIIQRAYEKRGYIDLAMYLTPGTKIDASTLSRMGFMGVIAHNNKTKQALLAIWDSTAEVRTSDIRYNLKFRPERHVSVRSTSAVFVTVVNGIKNEQAANTLGLDLTTFVAAHSADDKWDDFIKQFDTHVSNFELEYAHPLSIVHDTRYGFIMGAFWQKD